MGLSLLAALPAILSGFLFAKFCYWTRFSISRLQGQKLFFVVASIGLGFLLIGSAWSSLRLPPAEWFANSSLWASLDLPPHSGKALSPLFISFITLLLANALTSASYRFRNKTAPNERIAPLSSQGVGSSETKWQKLLSFFFPTPSIQKCVYKSLASIDFLGHEVDAFLFEASQSHQRVLLDSENRKVYLGIIAAHLDRPAGDGTWISLLPFKSGYRKEDSLSIEYTVKYEVVTYNLVAKYSNSLQCSVHQENNDAKAEKVGKDLKKLNEILEQLREKFPGIENEQLINWVRFLPFDRLVSISPFNSKSQFVTHAKKKGKNQE